jgi:antitoxin (DNA-binding transcriptional repressor) of toxin-antitoxin stability system
MKSDSSTNVKNNFSAYLDQVKNGQVVLILEYGKPIAQLSKPLLPENSELGIAALERQGFISIPLSPPVDAKKFLKQRIVLKNKVSLLKALIDERESGY